MKRMATALAVAATAAGLISATGTSSAAAPSTTAPLWLKHVQNYSGGISAGVRALASPEVVAAQATHRAEVAHPAFASGRNVQMNSRDSEPPLPQNETAVAASLDNPKIAVSAANDYVNGGNVVMRTLDGGRSWATSYVVPRFGGTGDYCSGGDPAVRYSRRDHVFYMAQLCFFRSSAVSEVQVYVSKDNGLTWTPGREAAVAATNYNYSTGKLDDSIFNDKEMIAVDNNPGSPHYGRLYVTYTKFHLLANGSSDYCPLQLSYTDRVDPTTPVSTTFKHRAISPDAPGAGGTGNSANQFSYPVVEPNGSVDIGFVNEECNSSYDPHLLYQRSTDGGMTFLPKPVRIDKPGQYRDFLDKARDDTLPPTAFRAPNTISMAYSDGVLTYVYQNNVDRAKSKANVSYQQSRDGGLHWSNMRWLSTTGGNRPARNDQFFPSIDSIGGGDLYAIWYDRRLDPANRDINTWEAVSHNNGDTWTSRRISTAAWNPNQAFFTSGAFIGDYIQVAVSPTNVYPTWADGRNTAFRRTGIGETDIFTAVQPR